MPKPFPEFRSRKNHPIPQILPLQGAGSGIRRVLAASCMKARSKPGLAKSQIWVKDCTCQVKWAEPFGFENGYREA